MTQHMSGPSDLSGQVAFITGGAEGFWPGLTKRQAPAPLALS